MIVIDRFEENLVVIELDGENYILPKSLFPENVVQGDLIDISILVDKEGTAKRLQEMQELTNRALRNSEKNLK